MKIDMYIEQGGKTVTDHIRARLYDQAGLSRPTCKHTIEELNADIQEKWVELDKVVTLAKNRLVIGTMRYGPGKEAHKSYDYGAELIKRATKYHVTGNLEFLVDALNFAALEFNYPHHKNAHFTAIDDGEHSTKIN